MPDCRCVACQVSREMKRLDLENTALSAEVRRLRHDLGTVRDHRDRLVESHRELRLEVESLSRLLRSGGIPAQTPDLD